MHACGTDWWRISTRRVTKASFPLSLADKSCQPQPALKPLFSARHAPKDRGGGGKGGSVQRSPPSFALARAGGQAATEVDNKGRKLRWGRGGGGGNASLSISAWKVVWPPSFPFLLPSPPAAASPTFALSLSYALGREKSLRSSGGEESLLLREGRKKTFAKFGTRTGEGGRRGVQSRGACSPRNQIQRILEKDIQ